MTIDQIQKLSPGLMYDPNREKILLVGKDSGFGKFGTGFVRKGRKYLVRMVSFRHPLAFCRNSRTTGRSRTRQTLPCRCKGTGHSCRKAWLGRPVVPSCHLR